MSTVGLLAGLAFVVAGVAGAGYGLRRRRQRRTIASVQTTDVLGLTPGPAEVHGPTEATDDGALPAPFSDEECLLAEWEIE